MHISREYEEMYRQFHRPSIIRECMIIGRGLDSKDTEASAKYVRSALPWPSLRLEETDKAMRRLPKNKLPEMSTGVALTISMKGKRRQIGEGNGSSDTHQLNLLEPS
jgi:hypothetical protein